MSTNVSSASSHFPKPQDGFTTTLSGSISSGAATVGLNSVGSYSNGDVFVGIIEPGVSGKEQTFSGIVDTSGVQITGVVWTRGTNTAHSAGVTVVDYVSATHLGLISKGILVEHNQDGTHDEATIISRTEDSSPATGDYFLTADVSATNALKKVTLSNLAKLIAPASTVWVPVLTGFSADPASGLYFYTQIGKWVCLVIKQPNNGTSSTTAFTITLPVTALTRTNASWTGSGQIVDNGTVATTPGLLEIVSAGTQLGVYKDFAGGAWTGSGNKRLVEGTIWYEAA